MSVSAMSCVWKHAPYEENTLLTLLAMADWSNDEGICWPSIPKIAAKTRQTERNVQYCLDRLKRDGVIEVIKLAAGRGHPAQYRINLEKISPITPKDKGAKISPIPSKKDEICDSERVKSATEKGEIGDIAIRKEPSLEPSLGSVREKPPLSTPTEQAARDLPAITLAQKVAAEVCLSGAGIIQTIAGAIEFCIKHEVITADGAVEFLIRESRAEINRGGVVDRFWFESRKWRKKPPNGKSPPIVSEDATPHLEDIRRRKAEALEEKRKQQAAGAQ